MSIAFPVHLEVVPDPPDDGEAGDEDGVAVVALHGLLAKLEEARQAAETEQLVAHRRVDAKSERLIRSCTSCVLTCHVVRPARACLLTHWGFAKIQGESDLV